MASDEFVIPTEGGLLTIEGVEVEQKDQSIPRFKKSRRYLLLLSLDLSTRIAEIALGPQGVLPMNSDNTFDKREDQHILQRTIKSFHNGSLDQVKRVYRVAAITSVKEL